MEKILKSKYEGMGFVEALIAIMVVGVSSVVLMQIAARTLQEMIQNETIDTMTQSAVEGATMVQNVAMQEKLTGENTFPNPVGNTNNCYVIDKTGGDQYEVRKDEQGNFISYDLADRSTYKEEAAIDGGAESVFFRIYCIESYDLTSSFAIVKVVVGQTDVAQVPDSSNPNVSITKGYSVKDYTYFTVVNL